MQTILKKFLAWTSVKISIEANDHPLFYFHEREIWWASLGANIGYEQDGKNDNFERPILVLKRFNPHILLSVPLTSKIKDNKYYFKVTYDKKEYCVILSQLRLISSKRLLRKIRRLSVEEYDKIRAIIRDFI